MFTRLVSWMMAHSLRTTFRRVCTVGAVPDLPPATPVILYANHHSFHDGYLLWLLSTRRWGRPTMTWMEEWDRFPFFAAVGALPFPPDDPKRRGHTIRRTHRRFRERPGLTMIYFPEGRLHPPDDGLDAFPEAAFARLARLLPMAHWCPVALHQTWWGEARPTALLGVGTPHATIDGDEHARLAALHATLRAARPADTTPLLEGSASPDEAWNFAFARRFFERYL